MMDTPNRLTLSQDERNVIEYHLNKFHKEVQSWKKKRWMYAIGLLSFMVSGLYYMGQGWKEITQEYPIIHDIQQVQPSWSEAPAEWWFVGELRRTQRAFEAVQGLMTIGVIKCVIGINIFLWGFIMLLMALMRWKKWGERDPIVCKLLQHYWSNLKANAQG